MKHTVHEHVLKNGAKGLVVNIPGADVCSMVVYFNSGFMFGDRSKYELPHVMEHLMGCGNRFYPTAAGFKTEVEKNGGYRNASTSSYLNGYVYECAAFEQERILKLLAAQISSPLFPEVSLATELSNVREELSRITTEYGRVAWNALNTKLFPDSTPDLAERITQLEDLTLDDVKSYYARTHSAANLRFFFAGDFADGGTAFVQQFETHTAVLPKGQYRPFFKQTPVKLVRPVVERHDIKQLYYVVRLMAEGGLDHGMDVRLSVARALLLQGYRSWIFGPARERGLAYHVSGSAGVMPSLTEWGLHGYVTYDHAAELFALMAEQVARVRGGDIPKADLEATKTLMIGSMTRSQQTAGDLLGWYAANYVFDDRIYAVEQRYDEIRSVTSENIVKAFETLVAAQRHGLGLVGEVSEAMAAEYEHALELLWRL